MATLDEHKKIVDKTPIKKVITKDNIEKFLESKTQRVINAMNSFDFSSLPFPDYSEVFNDHNLTEVVDSILEITNRYSDGINSTSSEIEDDLVRLSSFSVTLSFFIGSINGHHSHAEQNLKFKESQIYIKSDDYSHKNGLSLSNSDLTNIVRASLKEERTDAIAYQTASSILTGFMYSIKQFIETLTDISKRIAYNQ